MEIVSTNTAKLTITGKEGDYILLLPIGSDIQEAFEATSTFAATMARLLEKHKEKKETSEKEEKDECIDPN